MAKGIDEALSRLAALGTATREFDTVWREVEDKQSQSISAKKRLADDTKAFRKLADQERLAATPDLLKAYQAEFDALAKRAKFAEAALAELLKVLRGAPDASAVKSHFESALASKTASKSNLEEQINKKDVQIARLGQEVNDLETELKAVHNQAATVMRLKNQIKEMEAASGAGTFEVKRQKDEEWRKRVEDIQLELASERQKHQEAMSQLAQQRELHRDECERLRHQRLEQQQYSEQAMLAKTMEVESLSNDLENLQAELERERIQRTEPKETQSSMKGFQAVIDGAQRRVSDLENDIVVLRRQLADAKLESERREAEHSKSQQEFADSIAGKDAEIESLQERLSMRPSLEEVADLRRQLQNMETVEVADLGAAGTDLERRLLQRQRELENQLSDARVRASGLESELDSTQAKLQSSSDEVKDLRSLVQRLETDIGGGSAVSKGAQETAPPLAALLSHTPGATPGLLPDSERTCEAMPSMLEIVVGQRDRLRERAGDMEQERDRWRSIAEQERLKSQTLHADNVKLLEKVRYLQSYQPKQAAGTRMGRAGRSVGADDTDLEGKYSDSYDDKVGTLSPYERFQEDERARRVATLNVGERALVITGNLLLSSKIVRIFALVYTSTLHLLVFFVLLRLAAMHA